MEPFDDFFDFDFDFTLDSPPAPTNLLWPNQSVSTEIGSSGGDAIACQENTRKRGRTSSCCKTGTKACREKLRRERLNERHKFCDLSCVLDPGRPAKTDKVAILDDAVRVLNQLKAEAQELKETNKKLLQEIKCSKAEKNELREEKIILKADKERIERQLKDLPIPPAGFMPPNLPAYQSGVNKMAVFPNYGYIPMWQYLPQSTCDTSHDHELRPPAA